MDPNKPIAERTLTRLSDGHVVRVEVFAPQETDGHWECEVRVSGVEDASRRAHGADSFQALTEAFRAVKTMLADSARTLTWISNVPGDLGIPTVLPYEDVRLAALMETLADAERQRFYLYAQPLKASNSDPK